MVAGRQAGSQAKDSGLLSLVEALGEDPSRGMDPLGHGLGAIRRHLGMDVAFVSEFVDDRRVFRHVDSGQKRSPVEPGGGDLLDDSYCARVVDGRLPELIRNAADVPEASAMAVTAALPVGAHLSVPIRLSDGRVYGTFCCFSFTPDYSLTERDLAVMRVFADVAARRIEEELAERDGINRLAARIEAAVAGAGRRVALQPVFPVGGGLPAGFEALARFGDRTPDIWFAEAATVGLDIELDLACVRSACAAFENIPAGAFLAVNVTPGAVLSGRLAQALAGVPADRLVIELTEHAPIDDYEVLSQRLGPLRRRGVRIAVDDAGAGYASFRHILRLQPDLIKLDMTITRDIDSDPAKRALGNALVAFARDTRAAVIAEGIETRSELEILGALGVPLAQGYLLGRPQLVPDPADHPSTVRGQQVRPVA